MEFEKQEIVYYACIAIVGCLGGLFRQWRDGKRYSWRRAVGSIFSSGLFAFGSVGLWIGHNAGGGSGPFYFVAVAAFVGFYAIDVQEVLDHSIKSIIKLLLKRLLGFDLDDGQEEEQTDGSDR